jgi:hypothetical protein
MTEHRFPEYECHKTVRAARIASVIATIQDGEHAGKPGLILQWTGQPDAGDSVRFFTLLVPVTQAYMDKHQPLPGGYWVAYMDAAGKFSEDSYQSFSPADAFESGYRRVV